MKDRILTYDNIEKYLNTEFIGRNIKWFSSIDSTNKRAKEIGSGEVEGSVLIAEEQKEGKGRLGRGWDSHRSKGILMSIILKPGIEPSHISKITLVAAAAVYKALKNMKIISKIKWPNDILLDDKKICGILTEIVFKPNNDNYIVLGIGINVNQEEDQIPHSLKYKATSIKIIKGVEINRKILLANILNEFEKLYISFKEGDISQTIGISRQASILIGKDIRIIRGNEEINGKAIDINNKGELIVEFEDGRLENMLSGEVSVRGLNGYV